MSDNPNFVPMYSTNNIYRDGDDTICLEDELDIIEADISNIEANMSNKANINHSHDGYALQSHTHEGYATIEEVETLVGDTAVSVQIAAAIATKADLNHEHDNYAVVNHTHNGYVTTSELQGKADINHTHSQYATNNYISQIQSAVIAELATKASATHEHNFSDLVGAPTSLPANGGNADTVGGKTASEFATAESVEALQSLVGDNSVAAQINDAVSDKYAKPATGIPVADLASDVQASLDKADTAIQSLSGYATESYVDTKIAGIVDSSPEALNTLNELAAALGDDPNFATTIATQIGGKVDKVSGKGLSTNDYTTTEKNKLAGIAAGANKTTVDTALSSTSTNPVQNKVIDTALAGKAATGHTHNYAGASSAGGAATSANKLNTNAGSATQPVYFVGGVPKATTYTLGASVPSNAKFTDTTYSAATTSATGLMSAADKTKLNTIAGYNLTKDYSSATISGKCVKVQGVFMVTVKLVATASIPQWTKLFSVASCGTMSRDNQRGCPDSANAVKVQVRNNTEAGTGIWFQSATAIPAGTYYFDMMLM